MTAPTISRADQLIISETSLSAVKAYASKKFKGFFTREDLEDIAQDAAIKASVSFRSFDPSSGPLENWVARIAINTLLSAARYKARRTGISTPLSSTSREDDSRRVDLFGYRGNEFEADRDLLYSEFESCVRGVTGKLSPSDQDFLEYLEKEMTPKQISAETGQSASSAATKKCRLLKELKEPLGKIARDFDVHIGKMAG